MIGCFLGGSLSGPFRARNALLLSVSLLTSLWINCRPASAIPAFARKYGMPCSACHEAWPKLSPFGQQFKDNGYQMGNDRDAPIFQNPAYWPIALRITPSWHLETYNNAVVDGAGGPNSAVENYKTQGFDYGGMDMLTAGTLARNYSFLLVPSSDETGAFHFESVNLRFSNILGSSWFNLKVGKFELDNLLSEKRILTLSSNGGFYQNYHFQPLVSPGTPEAFYTFGIGDNQLGIEWMGHSKNDRTRVSASLLSGTDGNPAFTNSTGDPTQPPAGRAYSTFLAASQAFEAGSWGLQRVGGFAYIGQTPTFSKFYADGSGVPGLGIGNQTYYRLGLIGMWYLKKFDLTTMYFYGHDSVYLGTNTPAGQPLPAGAHAPSWNGGLFEAHYTFNPQMIFINRYELIRMSQQALSSNPGDMGDVDALTFGFRYYPFISSRAGFAFHNEYSIVWQRNVFFSPVTSLPTGLTSSSLMFGLDFAF